MYEIFDKLCKLNGVTPYKVSKATGISTATLSNWKTGKYTPKVEKLEKIAKFFDVSVDYLVTGRVDDENSAFLESLNNLLDDNVYTSIISDLNFLSHDQLSQVADFVKFLVDKNKI